jgi:hypothetical protein
MTVNCDRCKIEGGLAKDSTSPHLNEIFLKDGPLGVWGDEIVLCDKCNEILNALLKNLDSFWKVESQA